MAKSAKAWRSAYVWARGFRRNIDRRARLGSNIRFLTFAVCLSTTLNMLKPILHIPHASTVIPDRTGYTASSQVIDTELLKLTDWYTDDLFAYAEGIPIVAEFSRLFCDPERFTEDAREPMAAAGMGVLYEKLDNGQLLRTVELAYRERVLKTNYQPHHQRLETAVRDQLAQNGKALIIDCHSFPNTPMLRDQSQRADRPDFNIGTDLFHTPDYLIATSKQFFADRGYSLGVDWPYAGSIVPMKYYQQDSRVSSIMLEINRNLYLSDEGNTKSVQYDKIKSVTHSFIKAVHMDFSAA